MGTSVFRALLVLSLLLVLLLGETVPGGRYEVGGQLVDANGKPVKKPAAEAKSDKDTK